MKPQPRICDLIPAAVFEGFLLVKDAQERINVKGAKYLDINLIDITGEINAKKWDNVDFVPQAGQVVKIRGQVSEFNNRMQLRIDRMRESVPEDEVEMSQLIPCAPRKPEDMMEDIIARVEEMENVQLKQLVNRLLDEAGTLYSTCRRQRACITPSAAACSITPPPCLRARGLCAGYIPSLTATCWRREL